MTDRVLMGELFDPDDHLAQWVFQVTTVADDLAIADALLKRAIEGDAPARVTNYHYRQIASRVFEARQTIHDLETHDDVRAWVEALPDVAEELRLLRTVYLPIGNSIADDVYGHLRNRTVHHAAVGRPMRKLLRAGADQPVSIVMNHETLEITYDWSATSLLHLQGDLDVESTGGFVSRVVLARGLPHAFGELAMSALGHYCDHIDIDQTRFVEEIGERAW